MGGKEKLPPKRNRCITGWIRFTNFQPSCFSVNTLKVFSVSVAFAMISGQEKSLRHKNTSFCQTVIFPASRTQTLNGNWNIVSCIQTFVFGIYCKGSFRLPPFKWCVVNRKYQNRKSWMIKEVWQSGIHILVKVVGDSALVNICAFFVLLFSCLSYLIITVNSICRSMTKLETKTTRFGGRFGCVQIPYSWKKVCNSQQK